MLPGTLGVDWGSLHGAGDDPGHRAPGEGWASGQSPRSTMHCGPHISTHGEWPSRAKAHLALSMKALAAARRSCFRPLRFSMMLLPWVQATKLSISASS